MRSKIRALGNRVRGKCPAWTKNQGRLNISETAPVIIVTVSPRYDCLLSIHEGNNEIKNVLAVHAEDAAGASTIPIHTKGCNPGNNIAIAQEIGTT